ncbi:hypothetical protein AMATHDRAFT_160555, partial [Amanita thiersii Skay4041]
LFPPDSPYTVTPQYLKAGTTKSVDFIVVFEVALGALPVFFIGLKSPYALKYKSTRQEADDQMRERMGDLTGNYIHPQRIVRSVFSTQLCFYRQDVNDPLSLTPPTIPRTLTYVNDTAPSERWDCDLLDADGEQRLRGVVEEIKAACEGLELPR